MEYRNQPDQPELFPQENALLLTHLEAESPRKAYYDVSTRYLAGQGFLVQKVSGSYSGGSKKALHIETYFRRQYSAALLKHKALVEIKLKKKKGRIYRICGEE